MTLEAQVEEEVYSLIKTLPSLDSLISLAVQNAPLIKAKESKIVQEQENFRLVKKKWLDKVFSDMGYTYTNGFSSLNLSTNGNAVETASLQSGDNYRIGINVRMSILDIFGRPHTKKAALQDLKIAQFEKEALTDEISMAVKSAYSELISLERLLLIAGNKKQALSINYQVAEKKFKEGQIDISELGRMIELNSGAEADYERSKLEVALKFLELENLVGISLH
ncbi:MAG: TolC family protein [Microscillaceae bacterium]|nr:TolC family protein [Microscillaceae bacterium]